MYLCIDPGTKYLGYTIINNHKVIQSGTLTLNEQNLSPSLNHILLNNPSIHTVLLEKGGNTLRDYEKELVIFFTNYDLNIFLFQAKKVRKELKLERHPSSLSIVAKKKIIEKHFSHKHSFTEHELDSALLYLYFQKFLH